MLTTHIKVATPYTSTCFSTDDFSPMEIKTPDATMETGGKSSQSTVESAAGVGATEWRWALWVQQNTKMHEPRHGKLYMSATNNARGVTHSTLPSNHALPHRNQALPFLIANH